MEWIDFWNEFPERFDKAEYLRQVGKTFHGQPVSQEVLALIVRNITHHLQLVPSDSVLDLCCGNGLLTSRVSEVCRKVTAIDYSAPLIAVARSSFSRPNIDYYQMSVLDISPELTAGALFSKIYMYEALQHFDQDQLPLLLERLLSVSGKNAVIYLASIPDLDRIWSFYDTPELRRNYLEQKEQGSLLLGTWWSKEQICRICSEMRLVCEVVEQPADLYTSHYRFDVVIRQMC